MLINWQKDIDVSKGYLFRRCFVKNVLIKGNRERLPFEIMLMYKQEYIR